MNKHGNALVVGGGRGIGFAVVLELLKYDYSKIFIVGLDEPENILELDSRIEFIRYNLINDQLNFLKSVSDITTLFISAGFGRIAKFEDIEDKEITKSVIVNELSVLRILKYYYSSIASNEPFYCGVMGSIAGLVSSPLFSVYGATKASLCSFIESINAELASNNYGNRILNVSPGSLKGTSFNGSEQNLGLLLDIPEVIVKMMFQQKTLYIPGFEETYKNVLERYRENPIAFGLESYTYKIKSQRINSNPQITIGYLSGTFDLFHVGHLNLLKRAKEYCDYLVVGVHKSGSWKGKETYIPYEERVAIVRSIRYVDEVIESFLEDSDAYAQIKFDFLFVGSDYKGTERFNRYEEFFRNKNVQIIYFPYTQGTSSTQLRGCIRDVQK